MHFKKTLAIGTATLLVTAIGAVTYSSAQTEADIAAFQSRIVAIGAGQPAPVVDAEAIAKLPAPVRRYFNFVLKGPTTRHTTVSLKAEGRFRRPNTEGFNDTSAEQVIAVGIPALMFSATTPILPGIWARAYDYFATGEMEMKAKVLSTITVVDEQATPELNQISLRRWLLESALYPHSLLPGGPVTWEAISEDSARAIVSADGLSASMIASFDPEGRMTAMMAEEDGDLSTPYHGSGEHVARSDYRPVGNQMIPHRFTISRAANGQKYPFWKGQITAIQFESAP